MEVYQPGRQRNVKIAQGSFYLAVILEILIVIVDKSAYINPIEGRLFQLTFLLFLIKVLLTKYSLKEYGVIGLFLGLGAVSYFLTGRNEIVRVAMFLAACKDIDMERCLKLVFYLTLLGCFAIILLSLLGIGGAVSITQDYGRGITETRYTLGLGHPNALQCMVWALTALGFYLYGNRIRWFYYPAVLLINLFFFALTDSKTGLLAGIYTILFFFIAARLTRRSAGQSAHQGKKPLVSKLFSACNICVTVLSILLSVVIARDAMCLWNLYVEGIYSEKVRFYIPLDRILTGRISSLIETRVHAGVMETWSLFGEVGNGAYYFDLGWIRLFYWYGVIPALIAIGVLLFFLVYFCKKGKYMEVVLISAFSLFTVIEAHAVSVYLARNYVLFVIGMYWWRILPPKEESRENSSAQKNPSSKDGPVGTGSVRGRVFMVAAVFGCLLLAVLGFWAGRRTSGPKQEGQICGKCTALQAVLAQYLPGIVCWGDSLTAGTGGEGITYPLTLERLIEERLLSKNHCDVGTVPVVNMGVGGEDTRTILGRNGAVPFTVKKDFVIPAGTEPAELLIEGGSPLRQGAAGMESVEIGGIWGTVSIEQESYTAPAYRYYFARHKAGEEKPVPAGTPIISSGSMQYSDYVAVVFIGENGGYTDSAELIRQQKAIIGRQRANHDRFIIVGSHTGTAEERAESEAAMEAEYGDKYINLRKYMSEDGIDDVNELLGVGMKATARDRQMMGQGMTPESLLFDTVHFNQYGYALIGHLIYERMEESGYFEEIKAAIWNDQQ